MANYDVDIWGEWRAEEHPAFYNFLRSVLRPPMLLEFDSPGSVSGLNRQDAAFVRKLREDILRSDLSETGLLRRVIAPAPGMNFANTVRELESLRRQDIAAFARAELIGDDLMSEVNNLVGNVASNYLRGGNPTNDVLPKENRVLLDNFLADPFDFQNVNALKTVGDNLISDGSSNENFNRVANSWNELTDLRGVYGRADAGGAADETFRDRNPQIAAMERAQDLQSQYPNTESGFPAARTASFSNAELAQLEKVLLPEAFEYLTTGNYRKVATLGAKFLNVNQRKALDAFRADPLSNSARNEIAKLGMPGMRVRDVTSALRDIQNDRIRDEARDRVASQSAGVGDPDNPPDVNLPPSFRLVFDQATKFWKVLDLRATTDPKDRFVRYVDQAGRTIDANGNPIAGVDEQALAGREFGVGGPAAGRTTTPETTTPEADTTRPGRSPRLLGQDQGIDEAALARLEFGVGGEASGRTTPASTTSARDTRPTASTPTGVTGRNPVPRPVRQFETGADVQAALASAEFGVPTTPATTFVYDREPAPVPVDWRTAAQEMYPEYLAIVEDNPEIGLLLEKAIEEGYDERRFAAELRGTSWWKTTTATAREWDLASGLDPASYQRRVDEAAASIQQEALNLGIRLSSEKLQELALKSQRLGWGAQRVTNAIGMTAVEGGMEGTTQLREGYYGQQIRNLANQYGVSLAGTTFNSFVNKIAVGEETLGSFQDYAMTIGKSLYPSLSEQFDSGRTFEDITSSYKNIAANILERDSNSIDMSSPEFVQALTYVPDTKTGEQRLMNMGEWTDYLRKTESLGYQNTTEARSRAYEVSNKIANMFGRV